MARKGAVVSENKSKSKPKCRKIKFDCLRILLLGMFVYFAYTVIIQELKIQDYNVKLTNIQSEIDNAQTRIEQVDTLKEKVDDLSYMEEIARTELGLVKPYEKIFVDVNK